MEDLIVFSHEAPGQKISFGGALPSEPLGLPLSWTILDQDPDTSFPMAFHNTSFRPHSLFVNYFLRD